MSEEYISVIRITGYGGCGCSHAMSTCHIFMADTEEELQDHLKKTLLEWLWRTPGKEMIKEEFEILKKDEENIIDFIEGGRNIVEVEWHSEQWENLNSYCEFTQIEDITDEPISYEESLSPAQKAARTKKAIKEGKNPVMVHAGHKAAFTRRQNASV